MSHDNDAMKQRLYEMQTSYQVLSGIAIELVEALEASVKGITVYIHVHVHICLSLSLSLSLP